MTIENKLFDKDITIENEVIKLRLVTKEDIYDLKKIAFDKEIWKFYTLEINNENDLDNYLNSLLKDFSEKRNIPFVIISKKDNNKIVGMSSFGNIAIPDSRIEIGWSWLGTDFQGKGINGEYKNLLLDFTFNNLKLTRVEFKTDVFNLKARRGLVKIGAIEEGVLRSHTQMHSNRRRDTIYYSILKEEWNNKTI
jgi:RimJ/RimL family protein N-acetyltransferase